MSGRPVAPVDWRGARLTRRGLFLLAGLSLASCAERAPAPTSSPGGTRTPVATSSPGALTTARPTARSTPIPTPRASAAPSPTALPRSIFPCLPLPSNSDSLGRLVREELNSRKGVFGVAIYHLDTGESFVQNGERAFPSASLYKLGVLYEAWREISLGKVTLETKITITKADAVEGEPEGGLPVGETTTLATVLERMITVSSNAAAHSLLRTFGRPTINQSVAALGLLDTKLIVSGVRTGVYDGEGDEVASTSPRDLLAFLRLLGNGQLLGAEQSRAMREVLLRQKVNDRLPALLPESTPVAHKTGELVGVRNDAGIVYSPKGAYVIAVLGTEVDAGEATAAIARFSKKVYEYFVAS